MKSSKLTKIKLCNYCHKSMVEPFKNATLCVIERQRPSTKDYPKNLNIETKDIFYHQECYKEKLGIVDVSKLREGFKRAAVLHNYRKIGIFKIEE